uniref:SUEL-type lectin domain-containing protein n=1 Tax=Meloidogyne hapla TaxID=6305 RepID=A0A1I8BD14_MELHA
VISVGHITCYKNNGFDLGIEEVRCSPSLPSSPTYCLKANVYDGRVVRDCATSTQCPQVNYLLKI